MMFDKPCRVLRVIDGDTYVVVIDLIEPQQIAPGVWNLSRTWSVPHASTWG